MIKLSIITINYNDEQGLSKTMKSVIDQSCKSIEYVVIDGGSTDGSVDLIKSLEKSVSFWSSEKDKGIYDAQNKGAQKASGEYQLFLNSGDVLASNTIIEEILPILDGGKDFYYGNLLLDRNENVEKHIAPYKIDLDFMLNSTFWHPCVFIRSELFRCFGYYNTEFKIAGDYEFFIRCLVRPDVEAEHVNKFITLFDANGISNDPKQNDLMTTEREKAWKENVSEIVFESLKKHLAFHRSRYAGLVNQLQKMRGKQSY